MSKARESYEMARPRSRSCRQIIPCNFSVKRAFVLGLVMLGSSVILISRPQNNPSNDTLPSAQALFERGKQYLQERRFDKAVAAFTELLKAFPNSPVLYNLMGYCDLRQGLRDDAAANFKRAVALKPNYKPAHRNLGGVYLLEGRFAEAADQFRAVVQTDPQDPQAYYDLARAEFAFHQWQSGLEHLETAYALAPGNVRIALALAAYLVGHAQKDQARPILQKLAAIVPPDAKLQLELGDLLLGDGMQDAAIHQFEKAVRRDPRASGSLFAVAAEGFKKQNYELAFRILEMTGPSMQDSAAWHELAGKTYLKLGKPARAAEEFQKVIELEPKNIDSILQLGEVFVANNNAPAAVTLFNAAAKAFPRSPRIWFGLGVAYLGEAHYEDGVKALETSLALNPKLDLAYVVLGQGYSEAGRWDLLQKTAQRLIALNPQSSVGYYYEALALLRTDHAGSANREAETLLRKSVALDENDPAPRYELAKLLLAEGRKDAALQELQQTERVAPDFGPAHYQLFRLYQEEGYTERSRNELRVYQGISSKESAQAMRKMLVKIRQPENSGAPAVQ